MELACLEQQVPSCCSSPVGPSQTSGEHEERGGIEESQDGSHDELGMLEPYESNDGLCKSSQQDRTYESPGNSAWKGEVVIGAGQLVEDIRGWCSVDEHIVGGLDVEGFLNLGVGRRNEMYQDEGWYQEGKNNICAVICVFSDARLRNILLYIHLDVSLPDLGRSRFGKREDILMLSGSSGFSLAAVDIL